MSRYIVLKIDIHDSYADNAPDDIVAEIAAQAEQAAAAKLAQLCIYDSQVSLEGTYAGGKHFFGRTKRD